ncbi:TlpA disulfide reductase family protein [Sphingobacterium rhinopitheci]|uniref:TlpA disulfide reductase family protein n=1 Tax=Sphingobacterium rhinopitheci TaxID=2781960 RepID=UPI001F51A911|nr:TlpA disulfide reductase family protein [Sphingobacterium rhinopitheci]MCI0920898.1 AhpC/TSA family protein [Sphingobacterium rhinopitheci]
MKNLLLLLFLFCSVMLYGQGYTLKLKIENQSTNKFTLAYNIGDDLVIDSSAVPIDGWMVFKGNIEEPVVANVIIRNHPKLQIDLDQGMIPGPALRLILSNDIIEVLGDANTLYAATVIGGKANTEWAAIKSEQAMIEGANWLLMKKYYATKNTMSAEEEKTLISTLTENQKISNELRNQFLEKNPSSLVSLFYLTEMMYAELSLEELKAAYNKIDDTLKSHSYATSIVQLMSNLEKAATGQKAINFQRITNNGEKFNLNDLKGKYVLLDFWGSWCMPCRQSHPHLIELYNKYRGDDFELVGIAFETSKSIEQANYTWKKAIEEDKLKYINVLNNTDMDQVDIVTAYGISAFPTKVLLDKNGIIIARWSGDDPGLDRTLKDIFGF